MLRIENLLNKGDCRTIRSSLIEALGGSSDPSQVATYEELVHAYSMAKQTDRWPSIYDRLKDIECLQDIFIKRCQELLEEPGKPKPKVINYGIRIIDATGKRDYPLHQEWPGIKCSQFSIVWAALHSINNNDGGLLINTKSRLNNQKHKHEEDNMGYCILADQDHYKNVCELESPSFAEGQALIFGHLDIHGTARRISSSPRFALIARLG